MCFVPQEISRHQDFTLNSQSSLQEIQYPQESYHSRQGTQALAEREIFCHVFDDEIRNSEGPQTQEKNDIR